MKNCEKYRAGNFLFVKEKRGGMNYITKLPENISGRYIRYEVPDGAESDSSRNGGFGSTDK